MKYALRSLLRRPAYSATAVVVLACAIGASTAVFTLVDAVLIRPLPFDNQGRLAVLWETAPEHRLIEMSYPDFLDFRSETRAFQDVAAHGSTPWGLLMTGAGDTVSLPFGAVSGSFFDVLGARPQLGRTLNMADEAPGAPRATVLSNQLWQQRFGSDPLVIGRVISLDKKPYTVVGVMPPRFDYPAGSHLWAPLKLTIDGLSAGTREDLRRIGFLYMVGRLAPGVTAGQATSDATAVIRRLSERYPHGAPERRAVVTPLVDHLLGPTRPALMLLAAAVALVLLLGCINVAGLALVRAASRRPEIAVRYALGASRRDVLAMLFAEAVLLCACAVALAVPVAFICLRYFVGLAPAAASGIQDASLGVRAVAFACGAAGMAAAFVTVQPILALASGVGSFDTRQFGRSVGTGRGRQSIIAAEVALTVVVLTAAGLAGRSFRNLRALDLGYEARRVLLVQTSGGNSARVGELLSTLPGVRSAGGVSLKPLTLGPIGDDAAFQLEGQSREQVLRNPGLNYLGVTPGYFEAMGIRLLAGRRFENRDLDAPSPIAIVSDVTARAIWGDTNVVGRKVRVARLEPDTPFSTIVGVVASVRHREVHEARLDFYVPSREMSTWALGTAGDPAALAATVRTLLRQIDPAGSIETTTMQSLVDTAQRPWEFTALVLATFAALALLLAATAVYGLVAYAVSLRTAEFGIRMALGATPRHIVGLVFRSTGSGACLGLLMGVPASLMAARAMRSMLFEVSVFDVTSLMVAVGVLAIALVAACIVPSRRAALVDPTVALRMNV
jgi:putative ABC transport system permease protein